MNKRERIEWCDIWVAGADDDSRPRLLMVGDSIARSYFVQAEKELNGAFLCARLATSICVGDTGIAKQLALLLDEYRFAAIHFNNGLHGWDYDAASYAKGLCRVLDFIKKRSPQSKLILANTTPVRRPEHLDEFDPKTDRVRERNRIAQDIATKRHLPTNDLFSLVIDHPEFFSGDGVHFNPTGQSILGQQVAQVVLKESKLNGK